MGVKKLGALTEEEIANDRDSDIDFILESGLSE
jgi:hypothetical protein